MKPLSRPYAACLRTGRSYRPALLRTVLCTAVLVLAVVALVPANRVHAQGFGVYEQGTCVMGRAGAAVADPCDDASATFFNPAGLVDVEGLTVSAGATTIITQGDFTADEDGATTDLDTPALFVPHAHVGYSVNDRLAAGLGFYVPYGLGTEWPADTDEFEGSFLGYDNELQSIYIQPTLAYRLTDRIAVGAGLTGVIGSVELNRRLDLSQQPAPALPGVPEGATFGALGVPFHTAFADAQLRATGATGIGGHFGVQVQATDRIQLGARFLTPVKLDYEGTAEFEQVPTNIQLPAGNPFGLDPGTPLDALLAPLFDQGPLVEQDVETSVTMPAQLVAGVSVQATEQLQLLADYQWTGWKTFDEIGLDFEEDALDQTLEENYENTHGLRLGLEYAMNDAWQFRAGYITHSAAAPDETVTPLLPEAYRNEFTAGIGWRPVPLLQVDVAYQYIRQNDRRGRVRDVVPGEEDPSVEQLNSGVYSFNAHLIGATLTLHL